MMLLHSFAGLKLAIGAAAWAGSSLLSKPEAGFPVCVRTTAGRPVSLTIVSTPSPTTCRKVGFTVC